MTSPSCTSGTDRVFEAVKDTDADLVINATSLGTAPRVEESPLDDGILLKPGTLVMDMVYNPVETRFLKQARGSGARVLYGVEMLLLQGALSFELWTGQLAPLGLTEAQVIAHCRAHLEDFMVPKYVEFRTDLPMTSSGKISRLGLR